MQLYTNGTIHTLNPAAPIIETVLVDDSGRIAFAGDLKDVNPPAGTQEIDLGGNTLLPGFNDAHVHIWKLGLLLTLQVDVRHSQPDAIPDMVGALQAHAAKHTDGWILGRGYDEASMTEGRHPTRTDLDAVSTERPLAITRICGHIMALNTRAMELAGIDANTPDPPGGVIDRDEHGNPTGVLKESAMALVNRAIPAFTSDALADAIAAAHQHQLSRGITSATDPLLTPLHVDVYRQMEAQGRMAVRTNGLAVRRLDGGTETMPLPEKYVSDTLRLDSVKFFADGGLSGATAAIAGTYLVTGDNGVLRYDTDDLQQLMQEAHNADYRIATHAIGDRALEQVIGCYEALYRRKPSQIRHRIEHLGLPAPEHIMRTARMNAIAVPQTVFLPALGRNFRRYLPDDYLARCYPVRSIWEAGITVALSSDAPVVPDDSPLLGMKAAIDRHDHAGNPIAPDEAITIKQALWGYTVGGAIASGDHHDRGTIAADKLADFVVLDRDPLQTPTHELTDIRVCQTISGGKTVYEA